MSRLEIHHQGYFKPALKGSKKMKKTLSAVMVSGMVMKIIHIKSCRACPCREFNNRAEPFNICNRYKIVLTDESAHHDLDKVHPDCKLIDIPIKILKGFWKKTL